MISRATWSTGPAVGNPEPMSMYCSTPRLATYLTARCRNALFSRAANRISGTIAIAFSAAIRSVSE